MPTQAQPSVDIHDIKPLALVPLGVSPWVVALIIVCLLVFIGAAVLLIRHWLRRRQGVLTPPAPSDPPEVVALRELALLAKLALEEAEMRRRFHFELSRILRAYVEGRFGLNATDLTTEEIRSRTASFDLAPAARTDLLAVLSAADAVKFAKHDPTAAECEALLTRSFALVESTRPAVEPAPPAGAGAAAAGPRGPTPALSDSRGG